LDQDHLIALAKEVMKLVDSAQHVNADYEQRGLYRELVIRVSSNWWKTARLQQQKQRLMPLYKGVKNTYLAEKTANEHQAKKQAQQMQQELHAIREKRQGSKTVQEAITLMDKEVKSLAKLYGTVSYFNLLNHMPEYGKMIESAYTAQNKDVLQHFSALESLMQERGYHTLSKLHHELRFTTDPLKSCREILHDYRTEMMQQLHHGLNIISTGKEIHMDQRQFNCPVDLMIAVKAVHNHQYAPLDQIQHLHDHIIAEHSERYHQLQMQTQKNLVLTK
jgi:hypothetical protein